MTSSNLAVSHHVVIRCPTCGASEHADPAWLTGGPTIVCRECGETWPVAAPTPRRRAKQSARRLSAPPRTARDPAPDVLEARRRPLVGHSDLSDNAWAAKIEGDLLPEARRRSRMPEIVAALAAAAFLSLFVSGRHAAVAALPEMASLYSAIGLPVNLTGLAIEGVVAERGFMAGRVALRGTVRNVSGVEQEVLPLAVILPSPGAGAPAIRGLKPPAERLAPGDTAPFLAFLADAPVGAAEVRIRFARPAEHLPDLAEVVALGP